MNLINGKKIASNILTKLKSQTENLWPKPKLGIIQVGHDEASEIYVRHKVNDAAKVGIDAEVFYSENSSVSELIELSNNLNSREDIHGYIIQLPLPVSGDIKKVFANIDPRKDVDGLNPLTLGSYWQGRKDVGFLPATVAGIIECMKFVAIYSDGKYSQEELSSEFVSAELSSYLKGKDVVIVNHSIIVGKPLAAVLIENSATVTICHKDTQDLSHYTKNADIVITATGVPGLINNEMVKDASVLIDVGIKRLEGKVVGDIDFQSIENMNVWITPVPGGVGPLTRAMLLDNTYKAYKHRIP